MRAGVLAVLAFVVAVPLLLANTSGAAIHNGDEAIYAQMAREMADGGGWGTLTWQREPQFPRPPGAVWILAAARKLAPDERAVRWPLALAAGAEVALLVLLGAALFGRATGALAGGVLLTFDLFIGYARYLESEPFLCAFVVPAFYSWEQARRRPRAQLWILAWGAFLGCALMTKQILGGLPLLSPCVDAWARDGETRPVTRGLLVRGLAAAALVWLPWHVYALAHHGWPFVDSYLLANVLQRGKGAILHTTRFTYYGRELWRSEGWFGLIATSAVVWSLVDGIRKRERKPLTVGLWALGCFAIFTISASRYDHYVLLAYPALALATAWLIVVRLPFTRTVRTLLALAYLAAAGAMHLPRDLASFDGDEEVRALVRLAPAATPILTYNTHAYSARYYADADVKTLLESPEDFRIAEGLRRTGMPAAVELASDLGATLRAEPRPFVLLMPRARAALLRELHLRQLGESRHYLLMKSE